VILLDYAQFISGQALGGTPLEFSGGVRGEYWGYALGTLGFFAGLCAGVRIPSTLKNVWIKYVET